MKELKAAALKAVALTQSEWVSVPTEYGERVKEVKTKYAVEEHLIDADMLTTYGAVADYVVAAQPAQILKLIEVIEIQRKALDIIALEDACADYVAKEAISKAQAILGGV